MVRTTCVEERSGVLGDHRQRRQRTRHNDVVASVLGLVGPIAALSLFYLGDKVFTLGRPEVQTMMYLMLSVAGSMTIYLTRTRGPFWSIPPARKLIVAVTSAGIISVAGIFVTRLPWEYALLVWSYALAWFLVTDRIKLLAYRILDPVVPSAPVPSSDDGVGPAQTGLVSSRDEHSTQGRAVSAGIR